MSKHEITDGGVIALIVVAIMIGYVASIFCWFVFEVVPKHAPNFFGYVETLQ